MNRPNTEFIIYIYILDQFSPNLIGFPDVLNYIRHNGGFEVAKTQISALNVMVICVQRHVNISKKIR